MWPKINQSFIELIPAELAFLWSRSQVKKVFDCSQGQQISDLCLGMNWNCGYPDPGSPQETKIINSTDTGIESH